jgi:hypothetical protein
MFGAHECQSIPETSNRSLSRTEPFYEAYSSRELKSQLGSPIRAASCKTERKRTRTRKRMSDSPNVLEIPHGLGYSA